MIKFGLMEFEAIFRDQVSRYPAMQIQDLYKLIHQATLGSEHAVSNPELARQWLVREVAGLGEGPHEPLLDPISPDGQIMRVHLRPYVLAGASLDALLDAFVQTASKYRGDAGIIAQYWQIASGLMHFPPDEMDTFIRARRNEGFPAVHHSVVFAQTYRPAYRIIWKPLLG